MEHGLEVIDKGRTSGAHPAPLLFVHGGWHAAWCWDEHFLDFFAEKGYRAIAVSLRGHGGSRRPASLATSMADFVDDVASVADGLPSPPVVIAHSMGGSVAQHYLGSHAPRGRTARICAPGGQLQIHRAPVQTPPVAWHADVRHGQVAALMSAAPHRSPGRTSSRHRLPKTASCTTPPDSKKNAQRNGRSTS